MMLRFLLQINIHIKFRKNQSIYSQYETGAKNKYHVNLKITTSKALSHLRGFPVNIPSPGRLVYEIVGPKQMEHTCAHF
jgi:hypothetical protein